MRVRFLESVAGKNFAYRPKREYDLPEHVAGEFILSGKAVLVETAEASAPAAIAAAAKPGRRRGAKRAETQTSSTPDHRLF